jgi:periplasmic protein TonB
MNTKEGNLTAVLEPPARPKAAQPVEHESWGDDEEKPTGFKKWRMPLLVSSLAIFGVYHVGKKLANADGSAAKKEAMAMVQIMAPPPPAPPPPPPPPPKDDVREDKEVEEKEDTEPEPEPAVTTAAAGKGTSGIQIAAGRGNNFYRKPVDANAKTKWAGFSSQVARSIEDALRRNPASKRAAGGAQIRVWVDSGGRVTRVKLDTSTGSPDLDRAVNESLVGLQCPGIAPDDMPQPIRLRVNLRRPN